jgi:hypothetical protein
MTKVVRRQKRNKIAIILLAPISAVFFLVGWSLYYIGEKGHKQKQKSINKPLKNQENIELMAIPIEEQTIKA